MMNASNTQRITITVTTAEPLVQDTVVTVTISPACRDSPAAVVESTTAKPTVVEPAGSTTVGVEPPVVEPVIKPAIVESATVEPTVVESAVAEPVVIKPAAIEPPPYRTVTMAEHEALVAFVDGNPPDNRDEKLYYDKYRVYCEKQGREADCYDLMRELKSRGFVCVIGLNGLRWKKF